MLVPHPVTELPEVRPSPHLRRQLSTERVNAGIRAMLEEESAYGHGFLFAPVFVGCGAILWFSRSHDPPVVVLAILLGLFAALALFGRLHTGRLPPILFALTLALAGAMLAQLETRSEEHTSELQSI